MIFSSFIYFIIFIFYFLDLVWYSSVLKLGLFQFGKELPPGTLIVIRDKLKSTLCAFHFVEIYHFVEVRSVFFYIFLTDWILLTKICSSDLRFNRNILTSLYLKSETSATNYTITRVYILHKSFTTCFQLENLHWGYLLIDVFCR